MDETQQEKSIEAIRDWSKWLIGLSFGAAAGCVAVLEVSDRTGPATPFLVAAIVFFALSVLASAILIRETARVLEMLPARDQSGELTTVFEHRVTGGLSIGALARLQLILLGVAALLFVIWVILRSVTPAEAWQANLIWLGQWAPF
ncbi:MAG: hypothetical protein ACOC5M_02855 [Chloroflexota bacterium]